MCPLSDQYLGSGYVGGFTKLFQLLRQTASLVGEDTFVFELSLTTSPLNPIQQYIKALSSGRPMTGVMRRRGEGSLTLNYSAFAIFS